ncbi:DUF2326 domain-containing protein [Pseudomonas aeruginosa]
MLIYIECDKFRDRRITFKSGLNIVTGDINSSNSIGKSTLLKVIDFIYGGETFIRHSKDTIKVLGDHTYYFALSFGGIEYKFSRSTNTPTLITHYPNNTPHEYLDIKQYSAWLKIQYALSIESLTFRQIVSPVSRVWGKESIEVTKPLHSYRAERGSECIDYLIGVFGRFGEISDLTIRLEDAKSEKSALNRAFSKKIISKINKTQYNTNQKSIDLANAQLDYIRDQLSTLAISINEIIDDEVLKLKLEKDELLKLKTLLSAELERTKSNLEPNKTVSAKAFSALAELAPTINIEKLDKIESFHKGLTKVLHRQIKEKEAELENQLTAVIISIEECNAKIANHISRAGNPTHIVDAVADLTLQISKLQNENSFYDQASNLQKTINDLTEKLKAVKLEIIRKIEQSLNLDISILVEFIYKEKRTSPKLRLLPNNYSFDIPNDTGTGKAYASLILLDASLLRHTPIPYLIHDSFLFKNVEDSAIAHMLYIYRSLTQQTFIALDGSVLDSGVPKPVIATHAVANLSSTKLLYIADWRHLDNSDQDESGETEE